MRALRNIVITVLLLVLTLAAGLVLLVTTTRGTRVLLNMAAATTGMVLQWQDLQGSLWEGLEARNVNGSVGGTTWTLAHLQLHWQPLQLRERLLLIDTVTITGLTVRSPPSAAGEPLTAENLQALLFTLPVTVDIKQLRVADFSFAQGESRIEFNNLGAGLRLDNTQLDISALEFNSDTASMSGQLQLRQSLAISGDVAWRFQQQEDVYEGSLTLAGSLPQLELQHELRLPVQLTSNGTLLPPLFANPLLQFDLQHEFPLQPLAVIGRPDTSFGGNIHTTGSSGDGDFDVAVQLAGTVQNYPVALDGRVSRAGNATLHIDVDASSGSNAISVVGELAQTLALDWEIQAPTLTELLPTLGGALTGAGHLGGTRELPEISGSLQGQQLSYDQGDNSFLLDTLAFTANYGAQGNDVRFQLGTLRRGGQNPATLLQSATATLAGTPAQHTANAAITLADVSVQVDVSGAFVDESWSGTLSSASVRSPQYGNWDLQQAVEVSYAQQALALSQHCWDYQALLLCLQGSFHPERGVDAEVSLAGLSLAWLNADVTVADKPAAVQRYQDSTGLYLPETLVMTGALDVALVAEGLSSLDSGSLDLALQPRDVEVQWTPEDPEQPDQTALLQQRLAVTVNRSELHLRQTVWSAELDVDVAREQAGAWIPQGNINGDASLNAADVVAAMLNFNFGDLTWVETAVPQLRATAGSITGSAMVSGARTEPRLQVQMELAQGRFDLPEYRLQIRDIAVALTTLPDDSLQISGSAGSGPGSLAITARIQQPLQPEREVSAELDATNLLVMNTGAATTHLSSNVQLGYSRTAITLGGDVEIHNADFDLEALLRDVSEGAVQVSSDVVIVRAAPEAVAVAAEEGMRVPITLAMTVTAGDAVHVHGYDLDATLSGQLSLQQTPGQSLLVYGELGIPEGRYQVYNQQLNAKDGRLMFFGNATNPVIDLRAFRTTPSAEVGVWLTGAVSEVRGELYSTPTLPDSEILSLLVTGKSFGDVDTQENNALLDAVANFGLQRSQGVTDRVGSTLGLDSLTLGGGTLQDSALGLGKYLTPDLLVRYKVGLFDRESVLGVEYTLNENIRLKVESGISQSLELSYTIEKD